ncbi:NUDIX hydrolase [Brevundimonas sp.]|uniref:NUDIX hydrolase n=1 Tax=Brevundimonas sp. TaxID=1871086 RepID=UPI0037835C55
MNNPRSLAPVTAIETVYSDWTELKRVTFTLRSGMNVTRHVEDHGRSTAVLPYDPVRRCALLVTMARAPVVLAGVEDLLEAPAGRADDRESQEVARAEALEECGVRLGTLERIMEAWTMPAVSSELSALFIAEYSHADRVSPGGGLSEEGEEITVVEQDLDVLWCLLLSGGLPDLKTAFLLQALRLRRPELFSGPIVNVQPALGAEFLNR